MLTTLLALLIGVPIGWLLFQPFRKKMILDRMVLLEDEEIPED